jgi:hypothetical protein
MGHAPPALEIMIGHHLTWRMALGRLALPGGSIMLKIKIWPIHFALNIVI